MDAQPDEKRAVVDLFSHRACTRREMRRIDRIRFAAVIDNRLFIKVVANDGLAEPWLDSLTFTVETEGGTSTATGVAKVVKEKDGIKVATGTLSPPMERRRVTERCVITVTAPGGETCTFDYRPTFALKAL